MGQVIKNLNGLPFFEKGQVIIELNDTIHGNEKIIHFHYKDIRYEMSESDYLTILAGVYLSNINLERLKK